MDKASEYQQYQVEKATEFVKLVLEDVGFSPSSRMLEQITTAVENVRAAGWFLSRFKGPLGPDEDYPSP